MNKLRITLIILILSCITNSFAMLKNPATTLKYLQKSPTSCLYDSMKAMDDIFAVEALYEADPELFAENYPMLADKRYLGRRAKTDKAKKFIYNHYAKHDNKNMAVIELHDRSDNVDGLVYKAFNRLIDNWYPKSDIVKVESVKKTSSWPTYHGKNPYHIEVTFEQESLCAKFVKYLTEEATL